MSVVERGGESPFDEAAYEIAHRHSGHGRFQIRRFPSGLCHYVYEVLTPEEEPFVVRISDPANRRLLLGSVFWAGELAPLGIPIPRILHSDTDAEFPFTILERLPGDDLGRIYPTLSQAQKWAIASSVAQVQARVQRLPRARGYGFGVSYSDESLKPSWSDVIQSLCARAEQWLGINTIFSVEYVERLREVADRHVPQFHAVEPKPFLHDTTTKNVLVHAGRLSGIVDVDDVCFGDPLLVLALTHMALLSTGFDTDYTDGWRATLHLTPDSERLVTFYTLLFCVTFMGEIGQDFNRTEVVVDQSRVLRYRTLFEQLVARC